MDTRKDIHLKLKPAVETFIGRGTKNVLATEVLLAFWREVGIDSRMTIVLTRLGNAETLSHLRTERHCVGKAPRAQNFSAQCLNNGSGESRRHERQVPSFQLG